MSFVVRQFLETPCNSFSEFLSNFNRGNLLLLQRTILPFPRALSESSRATVAVVQLKIKQVSIPVCLFVYPRLDVCLSALAHPERTFQSRVKIDQNISGSVKRSKISPFFPRLRYIQTIQGRLGFGRVV